MNKEHAAGEGVVVSQWDSLPADQPMAGLSRQRVIGEKAMISRIALDAGCKVPTHAYENEQFICVQSGRLAVGLGDGDPQQVVTLTAGQVMLLPANVPHSAEALEDTLVLDIFG